MSKKILIIDDDKDILDAIQIVLEGEGYAALTIFKGDKVYTTVNRFRPDLIFLDVLMSGSDGRIICRKLKNETKTKHIPIVMISAHPSAAKEYRTFGAEDFLEKPFETDDLLKMVKKYTR